MFIFHNDSAMNFFQTSKRWQSALVGGTVAFHNSVQNRFMKCLGTWWPGGGSVKGPCWNENGQMVLWSTLWL